MRRTRFLIALVAVGMGSARASLANTDDVYFAATSGDVGVVEQVSHGALTPMELRMRELEARLAQVEQTSVEQAGCLDSIERGEGCCEPSCGAGDGCCDAGCCDACAGGCCGGCCDSAWLHPCAGWNFDAQLVFLRQHDSETEDGGQTFDTGSRYALGHTNACGHSWRVRYFEYDTDIEFNSANTVPSDHQALEYVDFEHGRRFALAGGLNGEFTAGLRWASFRESDDIFYDDSIGPVLGLTLRGFSIGKWQSYALARYSMQFGSPTSVSGSTVNDEEFGTFNITEVQLGVERPLCVLGCDGFVRGMFETQYWSGPAQDDTQDIGLVGLGFALGVNL
ncbi:MAG: hypothetical protein ACRCT8_03365 [Lacipirellulaceae bacterium]